VSALLIHIYWHQIKNAAHAGIDIPRVIKMHGKLKKTLAAFYVKQCALLYSWEITQAV